MTAVPPPAPSPQGSQQSPQIPVAVVSDPPSALLKLPIGSRLEGLVLSRAAGGAAAGSARIGTDAGTLDVQTPLPLAKGTALALVLRALTPRVQVQIVAVGRPPADAAPQPVPEAATDQRLPAIAVGTRLTATLARPAPWISGAIPQPATAQPAPPLPATAQPPTPGPPSTLPAGSQLTLRIVAVQPTTAAPPATAAASFEPTALAAGRSLQGTVIGATPAGQPILRTAAGVLTLATTAATLPRGTVLTVEITGAPNLPPTPPSAAPAGVASPVPGIPLPGEDVLGSPRWPALAEAVEALHAADPAAARQLVEAVLPRPDARLSTAVLFFLSALRGGDLRGWLGDGTVRALNRTRPDLSTRLGDDFRVLTRAADEPPANDWRVTQVPLFTGAEIEMIRLWTRRHDDPADDDDDNPQRRDQRFVVDVSLSRLGRLQFDGLVRGAGHRLDLIVRSESPLPGAMRDHIRGLFADTGAFTGLTGGVGFQAAPANFVDVATEPAAGRRPGVIV
jgi:hypothetical protein